MAYAIPRAATDLETLQDAVAATGNGNSIETIGHSTVVFQTTLTDATVTFEGTVDGTNYVSLQTVNPADGSVATTTTASGVRVAPCSGLQRVRSRVSTFGSGTVTVKARALPIGNGLTLADVDIAGSESVTVTQVTPGTAATDLGKAEDAAHTSGDVGVMALGVRKDTAASLAGTDGDYTAPIFDASGKLHTTSLTDAQLRATAVPITVDAAALAALELIGIKGADGAAISGDANPVPVSDAGGSLTIDNATLSVVGAGAEATAQRVTLATESLAALETITVDFEGDASDLDSGAGTDNHAVIGLAVAAAGGHAVITGDVANGLDVDVTRSALPTGASTLAEQQTQTASLSVIDDWDETNRAAVNTIAGQVGVQGASGVVTALTQRVVLATDVALPTGTNAIGTVTTAGQAADGAAVSGNPVRIGAKDDGGLTQDLLSDANGIIYTAARATGGTACAPTNVTTTANAASGVLKAAAGTLYGLSGYNARTSTQFILLFNSTTVPADTAQAVVVIAVAASSNFAVDFGLYGRAFSTGISWSNSSTQPLKTIGSADVHLDAQIA